VSWTQEADVLAAACFLLGALLALVAAIGVLRLPDLLSRMHAATKPQVLGLVLVLLGLGFRLRDPEAIGILVLVGLFQLLTTPVANHMVGRASLRAGQVREDELVVNDLQGVLPDREEPRGAP
jgi:multicomponent Na+:H+ antiporter subunit G